MVTQFVVGHSHDPEAERLLNEEQARHGGFMRLDMMVRGWLLEFGGS